MRYCFKALVLIVAAMFLASLIAQPASASKKPVISINQVIHKVGCVKDIEKIDTTEEYYTYRSFTCRDRSGREIYGENYMTLRRQAIDMTAWETVTFTYDFEPFWMARCRGYNVTTNVGFGEAWVKRYVKKNRGCKPQRIDGLTYSRMVS